MRGRRADDDFGVSAGADMSPREEAADTEEGERAGGYTVCRE